MRRLWIAALVVLAAVLAWTTLAWVGEPGSRWAWRAASGELRVLDRGLAVLPRWSWRRLPAARLVAESTIAADGGGRIELRCVWRPAPGSYRLAPAGSPREGLAKSAGAVAAEQLAEVELACLAAETGAPASCPPDPAAAVAAATAASIGAAAAQLNVTLSLDAAARRRLVLASIAGELPAPERKVLLLGLDGLDWDLVGPWISAGRMPNLGRLRAEGTWGVMETLVPTLSPLIWTTIGTGVAPDRHGILDFVERQGDRLVPVTGRSRKVPALWNLASALGRSVVVVGWWGSWPAERVRGVMVSDRLYYTLTQGLSKEVLREEPPEMVFPPERTAELTTLRDRAVRETDWRAVRYFMDVPEERFALAVAEDRGMEDPVDGFRRLLAATRTYLGAGLELAAEKPDLAMVYLEGTDTIGHLLAPYLPPPTLEVDPALAATYAAAVPRYFEIVDRWLGRYLEAYPLDEYAWVVVSDHGFKWGAGRPRGLSGTAGKTAPLWHETDAVFLLAGRGVRGLGRVAGDHSVYDVAPTVTALLGLPADPGWRGRPLPGCPPPPELAPLDWAALVPPGSYRQSEDDAAPVDEEFLAKLRALGYLGGGERGAAPAAAVPAPAAAAPPEIAPEGATRGQLNNLAVVKINERKYDEAERLLRRAIAQSPDYPSPHYNLRRIFMETERYEEADRELWRAVDKGLRDTERTIDRAAADYEDLGLLDRAAALLVEARRRFPAHEPFWVHEMVIRIRLEQCAAGVEIGGHAARRFPDSAPVHAFYGLAAACAGESARARAAIERSLELNPDQATLRRTLAALAAEGG